MSASDPYNFNYIGTALGMFGSITDPNTSFKTDNIQGMVELQYVKAGNDYISTQMNSLANAVQLTNTILQNLDQLQQIHNLIYIPSVGKFSLISDLNYGASTTGTSYVKYYVARASEFFNRVVVPYGALGGQNTSSVGGHSGLTPTYIKFRLRVLQLKSMLKSELATVQTLSGSGSNSDLYSRVQAVISDIESTFSSDVNLTYDGAPKFGWSWLSDNYVSQTQFPGNGGAIQKNLNYAVTAAQSLNTTQQENVRSFFFTFQQFYQSASAILTQLNQLMQRVAQGINR